MAMNINISAHLHDLSSNEQKGNFYINYYHVSFVSGNGLKFYFLGKLWFCWVTKTYKTSETCKISTKNGKVNK